MALDPDPYRILELPRGASLDDVKRAYRRLAKANHPDAAGEAALPRFLAIQAAYEQLLTGSDGGARGRRGPTQPRRAWEADPDRSDATRRAYGGRPRSAPPGGRASTAGSGGSGARPGGTQPGAGGGPAGARGASSGGSTAGAASPGGTGSGGTASGGTASGGTSPGGTAPRTGGASPGESPRGGTASPGGPASAGGSASPGSGPGSTPGRSGRRRASEPPGDGTPPNPGSGRSGKAKRNKATLGSTSYDGADGPFEPDWRGASWYGTTSGTYWTLNPKEYADPRKHGPEYQARARRAAHRRPPEVGATDAAEAGSTAGPTAGPASEPIADHGAGPTHTTSSWWDSTAGPATATGEGAAPAGAFAAEPGPRPDDRRRPPAVAPPPPDLGRAAADITHALTDERFGGVRGRVARAVIGWLPIAFGVGWVVGELTGCGRFAATCDGSTDPFVLMLQVAVLALLLLVPVLASIATMAAVTLFAAALFAALILSATGSAADGDSRRAALGAVLLVAWLVGVAVGVARRIRTLPSPTRPVS